MENTHGNAAIEFALLLPVFLLLALAIIIFGYWFVVYEADGRAVSSLAQIVSATAVVDQSSLSDGNNPIQSIASIATPLIGYNNQSGLNTGFLCAESYTTLAEAQRAASTSGSCTGSGGWYTQPPPNNSGATYYVSIRGTVTVNLPISDIFNWLKNHAKTNGKKVMTFTQNTVAVVEGNASSTLQEQWITENNSWNTQSSILYQNNADHDIIVEFSDPNQHPDNGTGCGGNQSGNNFDGGIELHVSTSNGPWNNGNVVSYWSQGNSTHGGSVSATVPPGSWYYINCDNGKFDPNSTLAIYE